ncbi:unnamed protein product [Lupinus luteus]|uniref:Uncharacterized protein n=1 Tax=Lupinus luteus TaxID=3873 RepID=A0AAV1VTX0_LUPLU
MKLKRVVEDKKLWAASLLIAWAASLESHMMWLQRQDSFKHKFGDPNQTDNNDSQPDSELN